MEVQPLGTVGDLQETSLPRTKNDPTVVFLGIRSQEILTSRDLYGKWSVSKGSRAGHSLFTQRGRGSDARELSIEMTKAEREPPNPAPRNFV